MARNSSIVGGGPGAISAHCVRLAVYQPSYRVIQGMRPLAVGKLLEKPTATTFWIYAAGIPAALAANDVINVAEVGGINAGGRHPVLVESAGNGVGVGTGVGTGVGLGVVSGCSDADITVTKGPHAKNQKAGTLNWVGLCHSRRGFLRLSWLLSGAAYILPPRCGAGGTQPALTIRPLCTERSPMSTETSPDVKPHASRNKLLIIIGAAIVVLLAIIAIAVSSQTIRAGQEAGAVASATAEESKMAAIATAGERTLADQRAEDAKTANYVCEQKLLKTHPTATVQAGKTKSTYKASDGSYDTGGYTDAPAGSTIPMQFVCASIQQPNYTMWTAFLKNDGHGSKIL